MPNRTSNFLANLISKLQAKLLDTTGWVLVRDNPCRNRHLSLSQEGYFETFDYVRLAQLELIASHIKHFAIPGDCAELGVFRGYFAQKIHEFLPDKKLILFDTFEGFDNRDIDVESVISSQSARDAFHRTSCESVLSLFKDPKQIEIRKGYFP
jgi:O-methyltransferase